MNFSLRQKVILSITIVIFVAGFLATYAIFSYSRDSFIDTLRENTELIAIDKAQDIENVIENMQKTVQNIASNNLVIDFLDSKEESDNMVVSNALHLYDEKSIYSSVYIMDQNGDTLVSTDSSFIGKNYGFRDYFQKAINGIPHVDVSRGVTSKELGYYFSHPVETNQGEIIGIVVIKLNPNIINDFMLDLTSLNPTSDYMIIDNNGVIFFSSDQEDLYKSLGVLTEDIIKSEQEKRFPGIEITSLQYDVVQKNIDKIEVFKLFEIYDEVDGEDELIGVARVKGSPFYIVVEEKLSEHTKAAVDLSIILAIFVAVSVVVTGLVISIIISSFLRPLRVLHKSAMRISGGDYSTKLDIDTHTKDLNELMKAFNLMIDGIKKSRKEIDKKVKEQTQEIVKTQRRTEDQRKAIFNILEDVDEEKITAESLASDLEKFKLAVENASDHVVITDPDGIVLYANKAVEKITGFSNKEVLNKKAGAKDLWGGLAGGEFYEKIWNTIKKTKKDFSGEIRNIRKDGREYDAIASISPILGKDKKVMFFVGIERDITREKEVDRAKTEFVSLASHQLRTPLSAINWYTEMLVEGDAGKLNKEQKDYLSEIYKGNQRMVELVNALLNVSRLEMGTFIIEPELLHITKISDDAIEEAQSAIVKKKIKFKKTYGKNIPKIKLDKKLTHIIFQNLLSNAVKYTRKNGKVDLNVKKVGNNIKITVSDSGYGIPKFQQEKIFSKLFRADNVKTLETEGTGLGLYLVKSIIDQVGGNIWFESEEGKGTRFFVTIPLKGMKKKEGIKKLD